MKKKTRDATPPIPTDFPAWCDKAGVTSTDIARECGVTDRQARRYLDNSTPVRLSVWKAIYNYSRE